MEINLSQSPVYLLIIYFIPVFFIILSLIKRRKQNKAKLVIPKYEMPDNVHPSLIGILIDGEFNKQDYIAGILDLVINKLLKIEKIKENGIERYFFRDLGKNKKITDKFREKFYDYIFKHIKRLPAEKEGIFPHKHRELGTYGFLSRYLRNRNFLRKYFFRGILPTEYEQLRFLRIAFMGIIFLVVVPSLILASNMRGIDLKMSLEMFLFVVFSGIILSYDLFFNGKSAEGRKLIYDMECYKEFLKTISINDKTIDFEKHLPYAAAFGISNDWVTDFAMKLSAQDWIYQENMQKKPNRLLNLIQAYKDIKKNSKKYEKP